MTAVALTNAYQLLTPAWRRALLHAAIAVGLLTAIFRWLWIMWHGYGSDSHAYWSVNLRDPYALQSGEIGAFSYSPAAALAFSLVGSVPYPIFLALWTALLIGIVLWLVPPLWWVLAIWVAGREIGNGNVHILIAAAIVLGLTRSAGWWAAPMLLKLSPGIGLAWHFFRREWRSLAVGMAVTLALAGVAFVLVPHLWSEWAMYLLDNAGRGAIHPATHAVPLPLWARLPMALGVVAYAARTDRPWLVPLAVWLALPVMYYLAVVILLAIPRLYSRRLAVDPDRAAGQVAREG